MSNARLKLLIYMATFARSRLPSLYFASSPPPPPARPLSNSPRQHVSTPPNTLSHPPGALALRPYLPGGLPVFRPPPPLLPQRALIPRSPIATPLARTFTSHPALLKKKGKESSFPASRSNDDDDASTESVPTAADFDAHFTKLESEITKISTKLTEDLSKLRAGRAEPSILENLDVIVDKADGKKTPLKELAHVVTKGRALAVSVYEAANVKKIVSAIQVAELNLQPVVDAKNPQLVNVPVPPPTMESRKEMGKRAVQVGAKAQDALRNARGATQKKLQAMKKKARPDDYKNAEKKMEDMVKKRKGELDVAVEKAKKTIETV